jgi:DNA-binding transcriptional LysR family regulator
MRLEQLEYFTAVVQHGSLRRASDKLHLSQPALSEAIGKLERELGVTLLDRRRSGARISTQGRELLGGMTDVLEAVDRLRVAAGDQHAATRVIRVGTVTAGTSTLVAPSIRQFQDARPSAGVEVLDLQQREIEQGISEGALDLGLVNMLPGDETPATLTATVLVHGTPVVVLPGDHPLVTRDAISADDLRAHRFVAMRSGYLMHRFAHRLFGSRPPVTTYTTDGAAMGKLMVAEGLGLTVLPDYSVIGDPLHRARLITHRPLADDRTTVSLVLLQRQGGQVSPAVRDLRETLLRHARSYAEAGGGSTLSDRTAV